MRSKLIAERDRDSNGKLTRWITGRRFIYIGAPDSPLPRTLEIGIFKASLYHREQKQGKDSECRKCLQKGHIARQCPNAIRCRQCYKEGHRAGDQQCDLSPEDQPLPPPPPPHSFQPPPSLCRLQPAFETRLPSPSYRYGAEGAVLDVQPGQERAYKIR